MCQLIDYILNEKPLSVYSKYQSILSRQQKEWETGKQRQLGSDSKNDCNSLYWNCVLDRNKCWTWFFTKKKLGFVLFHT